MRTREEIPSRRSPRRRGARGAAVLACAGALSVLTPAAAATAATATAATGAPATGIPATETAATATGTATAAAGAACIAGTGPYQRQLEQFLKRKVDGRQSTDDCDAIRAFQRKHHLTRRDGYAGLETYRQTQIVRAGKTPNADGACPVNIGTVVCVDMTRQILWLQTGKRLDYGPVPTRTGRWGEQTRPGLHKIFRRVRDDYSREYNNSPMPYSQYFDGGQAIHGRYDDLYDGGGSAGCVNLRLADAEQMWKRLGIGSQVYIWGDKPGTAG